MGAAPPRRPRRRLLPAGSFLLLAAAVIYFANSNPSSTTATSRTASRRTLLDATAPARVHGHITKAGPLAVVSQLVEGAKWSDLLFPPDWVAARLAGEAPEPPSKYCNPMFNDKYKFIYVKCPKTGGTTIMDGYFSHCDLPKHYDWCLHMADYTNVSEVAHLNEIWSEYFVFGFSRNVLRRAVSQYQYLAQFVKEDAACGRPSWDEYCPDPYLIGDVCARKDSKGDSCCTLVPEHQYLHVSPQANCLAAREGGYALDWLGRVESFYDDFGQLISLLNARKGVPKLPEELPDRLNTNTERCNTSSNHGGSKAARALRTKTATGSGCNIMEFFTGRHAHCYDSITRFYAEDIALLS